MTKPAAALARAIRAFDKTGQILSYKEASTDLLSRLAAAGWRLEQESKVQDMHNTLVRIALCVGTCPPDIVDIARHAIGKPSGNLCAECQNIGHHGVCGACSRYERIDYYYPKAALRQGEQE